MAEIQTFFRTIISKFFARDTACRELCDVCARLFNTSYPLHTNALMAYQGQEAKRANYQLSMHKQRVEAERQWRLGLKVGDPIDAVKAAQIKGLTIKSWSRGTVVYVGD